MPRIGLKLWSTNMDILPQVSFSYKNSIFDYIELYFVPDTLKGIIEVWSKLKIPIIVHAPHFDHGFNLADSCAASHNTEIFKDVLKCADILTSDVIIVHGGNGGSKNETIRQLKRLKDSRLLIENKPMIGLNGRECIGYTPEDIDEIVDECRLGGFVLDFNHAACSARSLSRDPLEYIKSFVARHPKMFHFGDGDYFSLVDTHKHLGHGNMPLTEFIAFLSKGSQVTIETPNDFSKGFSDFENNRAYFVHLFGTAEKVN